MLTKFIQGLVLGIILLVVCDKKDKKVNFCRKLFVKLLIGNCLWNVSEQNCS